MMLTAPAGAGLVIWKCLMIIINNMICNGIKLSELVISFFPYRDRKRNGDKYRHIYYRASRSLLYSKLWKMSQQLL